MKAARALAVVAFMAFALATLAFLVVGFRFGYIAALRPGPQSDPEFDAAMLSFLGAIVSAALTMGSALGIAATDEEW
jgi:hypothetical protein